MNSYQYSYLSLLPTSVRSELQSFSFPLFHLFAVSFAILVPLNLSTILLVINVKPYHCVENLKITFAVAFYENVYDVESPILPADFLDFHLPFVELRRFVSFISNCDVEATSGMAVEKYAVEGKLHLRLDELPLLQFCSTLELEPKLYAA